MNPSHQARPNDPRRRRLLKSIAGLGMGSVFSSLSMPRDLHAQQGDYRALVCLFSAGGMDHNDTIMPYDQVHYDQMRSFRQGLMNAYSELGGDASRDRTNLLPLTPSDNLATEGRRYAVPRELAPLKALFDAEELVFVGGVGALIEPTDRASYESRSVRLPPALFSHNDQQNYWQGLKPEGAKAGWGGRFMDSLHGRGLVGDARFGTISAAGNQLFIAANELPSYVISRDGPARFAIERDAGMLGAGAGMDTVRQNLGEWLRTHEGFEENLLADDIQVMQSEAIDAGDAYELEFSSTAPFNVTFPGSTYGTQLRNVAKSIRIASAFGMQRQIFFVQAGGFDTHAGQATGLPPRQAALADAVKAFRDAMIEIGAWNDVTVFSAADFGRTMIENGTGTDHGWGGHHFITGGSVRGGRLLGRFPEYDPEGAEYTASRARLIPSVPIERYSATLGEWLGVDGATVDSILPNLANFGDRTLDVFRS